MVLALPLLPLTSARAAPPSEPEQPEDMCEFSLEAARLMTGRDLYARGNERFEQSDYLGAVEAWQQVLLLMPEKQADLRVQLAHAHRGAYAGDADPQHLNEARALFRAHLDSLAPDDTSRTDIEAELAAIEVELDALAEAEAEARAAREEAIRQEQIRLNEQALAEAEAEHQRNLQKIYLGAGGSLTGLGVGSLAAMSAFLIGGARLEQEGQTAASSTGVAEGFYQDQLARGVAQNRAALATGIVGGVLTIGGGSLLIVAALRHQRGVGRRDNKLAIVPTIGGVQVRF